MISAETIAELEARGLLYILGVRERPGRSPCSREDRAMSECDPKRAFAARPSDAEAGCAARSPRPREMLSQVSTPHGSRSTSPSGSGRIKVAAFQRGLTVADMLRALLACEFPEHDGGAQ